MCKGIHSNIKNRFEIRLRGDTAEKAIHDLLSTRNPIELEMRPEPYAMENTMKWLEHQVAPTLALLQKADERSGTNLFKELTESVTLKEHHKIKLKQMTTDITEIINTAVLSQENDGIF